MQFEDRADVGRRLADKLAQYAGSDTLILALPRGGVPLGVEMARLLHLPLDVIGVRKLGVPGHEELAFGAIATGGVRVVDQQIIYAFGLSPEIIEGIATTEQLELDRRESAFRLGGSPLQVRGRAVILVDDGIATGSTMLSAIAAVRRMGAARVVVATGVAPESTSLELRSKADEVVCLLTPREFRAVSVFYSNFPQLTDEDVRILLQGANQAAARPNE